MKKNFFRIFVLMLALTMLLTSCVGNIGGNEDETEDTIETDDIKNNETTESQTSEIEHNEHYYVDGKCSVCGEKERIASKGLEYQLSDDDLEAIMMREFGPIRRKRYSEPKIVAGDPKEKRKKIKETPPLKKMVIIDGYNLIYSWDALKEIADDSLEKPVKR